MNRHFPALKKKKLKRNSLLCFRWRMLVPRERTCFVHVHTVAGHLAECLVHLQPQGSSEFASAPGLQLWPLPRDLTLNMWSIRLSLCHSTNIHQDGSGTAPGIWRWRGEDNLVPPLGNPGAALQNDLELRHVECERAQRKAALPSPGDQESLSRGNEIAAEACRMSASWPGPKGPEERGKV